MNFCVQYSNTGMYMQVWYLVPAGTSTAAAGTVQYDDDDTVLQYSNKVSLLRVHVCMPTTNTVEKTERQTEELLTLQYCINQKLVVQQTAVVSYLHTVL